MTPAPPPLSQSPLVLAGKVALVTGGAKRIGRAIALELARAGAAVAFTFRESREEAFVTEQELRRLGGTAVGIQVDLTQTSQIRQAIATTLATLGRLDVVVNNAGRYEDVAFEAMSDAQWDAMLNINLKAPFVVSREAIPALRAAGGGRIIHLASVGGLRAFPTHAHYCASKAGLIHLTQAMARALAPTIQVNAVAPGLICVEDALTEWEQKMVAKTPAQRAGRAEDVAAAVLFFATCTPFITGQTLVVDGGLALV